MRLITDSKILEKEFLRLLDSYNEYYWLTAWASTSSKAFEKLDKYRDKIKQIVVGLHFYQTHPDFIEKFLDSESVRYIKQPEGTFHPKMFLFYNSKTDWEILIGSANFTHAAFNVNTEISTLITSRDSTPDLTIIDVFGIINSVWADSNSFDKQELDAYRKIWKNNRPKIKSLSGKYGNRTKSKKQKSKPIYQVPVANMDWKEFIQKVRQERHHSLDSRIKVLEIAKDLFKKADSFSQLETDERKFIAGIDNNTIEIHGVDCKYFGSMIGSGKFKNKIIENDSDISKALDEIPLSGQITKRHYDRFLDYYSKSFDGNFLGTATRLLAMKRPDIFVCLDSKNKSALCKDFEIVQSGLDYQRYWDDIILRIYDSEWWLNPDPKSETEKRVSDSRAAFLDSLYYEE